MTEPSDDEPRRGSAAPIIAAAAVVIVVAAIIAVLSLTSSPEENISDNQRVGTVVSNYVDAKRSDDTGALQALQCPGIENAPLADADGSVELNDIEEVRVNGDAAEADVRITLDGSEQTVTWTAVRSGENWLLCSS